MPRGKERACFGAAAMNRRALRPTGRGCKSSARCCSRALPGRRWAISAPGAGDIADLAPEMRDRLPGSGSGARLKDTAEARFRMFEAIRRLLAGACEHQPLVLVLDDLHWADAPSLRLLEFLAPEIADIALMLVGTYRATELSRQHPLSNTLGGLARAPTSPASIWPV